MFRALVLVLSLAAGASAQARQAASTPPQDPPAATEAAPAPVEQDPEAAAEENARVTSAIAEETAQALQSRAAPDRAAIEDAARTSADTDARIAAAVAVALARAPAIPDVGVDVNASVVTLSGSVVSDEQRQRAGRLAKGIQGVSEVDNQLQLSTNLRTRLDAAAAETRQKVERWIASTPLLLVALLVALGAGWLGRFIARHLSWLKLDAANPYLNQLISRIVQFVVTVAGIVMALDLLGATKLVGAVIGSAGVVGLALGFAFRDIAENYIAGIMLSLRRPFAPGDMVNVDGKEGRVVSLSARATILMTLDGNHLRLPNAMVFKAVILNYTANPRRRITMRTDIDGAESVAEAERVALAAVRRVDGILEDPAPRMLVRGYGSQGTEIELQCWVDQTDTDFMRASSAVVHVVKSAFAHAQIEATRTTHFLVNAGSQSVAPAPKVEPARPSGAADTAAKDELEPQLRQAQAEQADTNLIAADCSREE